jgi:PncC family amidohydrolase
MAYNKLSNKPSGTMLAKKLGALLTQNAKTLAVAESCTGGLLGGAITAVPGSSAYFKGGVIAYSNELKQRLLGVPKSLLDKKGAVSAETVEAMASGACRACHTDCAIAVSGVAGPGGGTREKPVGLVYVGIAAGKKVRSYRYLLKGNRRSIRKQAVREALERMVEELLSQPPSHSVRNQPVVLMQGISGIRKRADVGKD